MPADPEVPEAVRPEPEVRARRLEAEDAGLALAAFQTLQEHRVGPGVDERHFRRFLEWPGNVLILAWVGDQAVGFLVAYVLDRVDEDRPMVCLYEIGVAETHRGTGVGRRMVEVLLDECAVIDARKAWTVTTRSNLPAARLFRRTGARASAQEDVVYVWDR